MKIWTITTDDRNGHECRIYYSKAAADAAALEACRKDWPKDEGPCPDDWQAAMEVIEQGDGLMMWVEEHDISDHPDIAAAIETLDEAEAIVLHAKKEEAALTLGELIDVYDAIADASGILRGNIAQDSFGISPNLQDHIETETDAYRKAATDQATDDLEIDPDAYVAVSEDGDGAFVAAWLWVPESDAAKHMPPLPEETMQ